MATFNFTTSLGQTLTFDATADLLSIGYPASDVTLTQSGSNVVVTVANVGNVTLANTTIGQLNGITAGTNNANIGVAGGQIVIGDGTNSDAFDAIGQDLAGESTGSDLIFGMGGGDTINDGTGGNDVIFGGSGITDTTDGGDAITINGTGAVTVYGNAGNDTVTINGNAASGTTVNIYGGLDNDTVNFNDTAETVTGSYNIQLADGNDTFDSNTGGNAFALSGTATVSGGGGSDTLDMSEVTGDSTVYGGAALADSTDGADTITQGVGNATIYGNAGADTIFVAGKTSGTTFINGGLGNDTITDAGATATAALGAVTVQGGSDQDNITISDNGVTSLVLHGGNSATDSTDGADTIAVTDGGALTSATILGNAGNDTISFAGGAANNTVSINGGLGDDTYTLTNIGTAGTDAVTVEMGSGSDTVNITTGNNTGAVVLNNFSTDDTISTLNLNSTAITTWSVAQGSGGVVIGAGTAGSVSLGGYTGDLDLTISNGKLKANFDGAADTITGTANVDYLISGSEGDTIRALAGNDKIDGNAGDDIIEYDADNIDTNDTIDGGAGTADTISFTGDNDGAAVTDADFTNVTNVEKVIFSNLDFTNSFTFSTQAEEAGIATFDASALASGNDVSLIWDANYDLDATVTGGAGNDTLNGSAVDDNTNFTINAGNGNDVVTGGALADTINGGDGNDTITMGNGNDSVTGGNGTDTFTFDNTVANNGLNTITDFTTSDVLDLGNLATDGTITATVADTSTGAQAVATNDVVNVTDADGNIDTAAELVALFTDGAGNAFNSNGFNGTMVVAVQGTTNTTIWNITSGDAAFAAGEATQIATLSNFTTALVDANVT